MNIDHGTLPASVELIKEQINTNNFGFGVVGSSVYAGMTIGCALSAYLFQRGHWMKPTLSLALLMNSLCLYLFAVCTNLYLTIILRFCIGFFQIFPVIFYPVWIDAYGTEKQKSAMLSIILLATPLGTLVGYNLAYFMIEYYDWRWAMYIQALAIIPLAAAIFFTPKKYINFNIAVKERQKSKRLAKMRLRNNNSGIDLEAEYVPKASLAESSEDSTLEEEPHAGNYDIKATLLELRQNSAFICLCISLTGLYFVVTGIQFWLPDYLMNIFELSPHLTSVIYTTICVTGPILGVVIGGLATTFLGGYNSRRAQEFTKACAVISGLSAIPIPFIDSYQLFTFFLWMTLFFGGSCVPCNTGVMLNTVSEHKRGSANSIANLFYHLFGFLPAPSTYGLVSSLTGGSTSRWPMGVLLYSAFVTIACFFAGMR